MILDSARQKQLLLEILTDASLAGQALRFIRDGNPVGDEYVEIVRTIRDAQVPPDKDGDAPA